jgi:hypothetical protein
MAYIDPNGREVTAADALSNGKLRNGYRQTMSPGEYLSFDMLLMDAKPKSDQTSIDAELRETIARLAKNNNQTPEEYLAATPMAQIQRLASEAAVKVVEALSGKGIASQMSDAEKRGREAVDHLRKHRYNGYGAFIQAADTENPVRPTIPSGMSPTDAVAYLRKARYA